MGAGGSGPVSEPNMTGLKQRKAADGVNKKQQRKSKASSSEASKDEGGKARSSSNSAGTTGNAAKDRPGAVPKAASLPSVSAAPVPNVRRGKCLLVPIKITLSFVGMHAITHSLCFSALPHFPNTASGKRVRRKHDPNAWETSTPSIRTNVLCLGVSYPCIKSQLRAQEIDPRVLNYSDEGVDQMVELVQRSILTEMDGRDMVRCLAMEAGNDTMAYWCVFEFI